MGARGSIGSFLSKTAGFLNPGGRFLQRKLIAAPRKIRKDIEEAASTAIAEEKAQLLKEEEALEQSTISARNKALQERRARQIRRGRSSTIIAGRGATPNLTQLGQVLKKKLGTGA